MPRFERRVLVGGLLVAVPAWLALVALVALGTSPGGWLTAGLLLAAGVATGFVARWHRRRVVYPLYTLSGLLEALRQGDYSMRGAPGSVLGDVFYDVNALAERLQEERLDFEETSHLLGKTLAALSSAVFVFDGKRRLRLANPAGQELLDAKPHVLFGRTAAELALDELLDGPAGRVLTHAFPGRSGRFEVRHAVLRSHGRDGRLLVVNDVGRVLREEERQAWKRLLRVLGHEVNNSLAPIRSMAGTLATLAMRDPLPADWRDDFASGMGVIEKRADALARFLAGYATLARLPPPRRADVDLAALLRKMPRMETRVPVVLEDGPDVTVHADADQIEQALINLLRNAAEASGPHRGGVRMRWRQVRERVLIEIDDDGAGPPSSDNLFVPFYTTKPGGSGIGLALVRQIAEAHDGGISLSAGEGGGTRATLWLPLPADDTRVL